MQQEVEQDHLCFVCHLLMLSPVTTNCGHTLCGYCWRHWSQVSEEEPFREVPLSANHRHIFTTTEAGCPFCRTKTKANPNHELEAELKQRYAQAYKKREEESEQSAALDGDVTMTVFIGNTHENIVPQSGERENSHKWTFFVRPDHREFIDQVYIELHPTFRPPILSKRRAPYEVMRIGWGIFQIFTTIILKKGFEWTDSSATTDDASNRSMLEIPWMLSFDGAGKQSRGTLKVKRRNQD